MATIQIVCSTCKATYEQPTDVLGTEVECACGEVFVAKAIGLAENGNEPQPESTGAIAAPPIAAAVDSPVGPTEASVAAEAVPTSSAETIGTAPGGISDDGPQKNSVTSGGIQSFTTALVVHGIALTVLYCMKIIQPVEFPEFIIETHAPEERVQEEFTQELETNTDAATQMNLVSGGAVTSTAAGGKSGGSPLQQKVDFKPKPVVSNSSLKVASGDMGLPGDSDLGLDLGEGDVKGEGAALVEGYGPALGRLAKELIRLMRKSPVTVVWMFDESGSMKDDQQQIKANLDKLYEELKLVDDDPAFADIRKRSRDKAQTTLLTAVTSFGAGYHEELPKPSNNVEQIMAAIDQIPVDPSGEEKMCAALMIVLNKFKQMARARKLVIVMVSDESGDDAVQVIPPIQLAKSLNVPIYIMGRESVFGSLYAYVPWQDPATGTRHRLPIRRGPETAFPESLQWDGFRRRFDAHMSGFGPYSQVKLSRDTGGIFFQLPHEDEKLVNFDNKKYAHLDLKEYIPDMRDPAVYLTDLQARPFRKAMFDVILQLNPHLPQNKGLEIPEHDHFDTNMQAAGRKILQRINQIATIITILNKCQQYLEAVRELRASEPSKRWRAAYDLMYAQIFAYKIRLFQYAISIGRFSKNIQQHLTNPTHNRWYIRQGGQLVLPDEAQTKALGVTADDLSTYLKEAQRGFALVQESHPNTPWAVRAAWEEKRQFGARIGSYRHVPSPPRPRTPGKPAPRPTPKPKL